jgi:hypothetical protein
MQTLKENWMREIEEVVDGPSQPLAIDSAADDDEQFDNDTDAVTTTVSNNFALNPSSVTVENMLDPSTIASSAGAVNFEYDTYGIGTFDIPCASEVMSQAVGLSDYRTQVAYDTVFFDESCQQQQSALFNEESVPSQEWM